MRTYIKLGRVFGIEIGLHYSWFLIAFLIMFTLGEYFRAMYQFWSTAQVWGYAGLTAVLFFVTLLAHELSHSLVARARGMPVRVITLFALGGMAQIGGSPATAKTEFLMAIVGPLASAVIGAACLGTAYALGWQSSSGYALPIAAVLGWLGYINIALAVFNMIPGYPLDGGRVLRAIVWWKTGNADRSTRITARIGQGIGVLFIAWGLLRFMAGYGFGGLWIALIGWFLMQMAGASYAEVGFRRMLEGVRVRDLMSRDWQIVSGHSTLRSFVSDFVSRTGRSFFLVEDDGHVEGLVGPGDLQRVSRDRWDSVRVEEIMDPIRPDRTVSPETPVTEALEVMARNHLNQVPVVSDGHLDGIFSRGEIAQFVRTHAELRA